MKKNKLALLLFATIVILVSCNKDTTDKTELPLEYKYVLLDTLGNEKTEFNQGENIVFSFQIINKGSEDLLIRNFLTTYGFFKVYQINTNEDTLDYGYPWEGVCLVGGFIIPKNDTSEFNCPWVKSENNNFYHFCLQPDPELHETYLPIGNFYTIIEPTFEIPDLITETKYFKINFTVK